MSTIQHINSAIDHFWPQYQRKFPAFLRPEIVPAETLRGMAPVYMRRNIDQDPTSYYMFVRADPMQGDCSREAFKEIVADLFYDKLGMASSYSDENTTPEEAVDKEILPAARDAEFLRYYNEQLAAAEAKRAEEEKKARADKLGFDPDDPDIIDVDDDGNVAGSGASSSRAVSQAQTTAVATPKLIWFAVDMHVPAGGMLGYSGGGRLNGRRGSSRYLHEAEISGEESKIRAAYEWAKSKGLCSNLVSVSAALDGKHIDKYDLFVFKYADGTYTWIEMDKATKIYSSALKNMSAKMAMNFAKMYRVHKLVELSADEFTSLLRESRHALKLKHDKMLRECYMKKALFSKMLEEACSMLFSGSLLSESAEDEETKKDLEEKLAKIKTPEDLKKFMEENADKIKANYKKVDKESKSFYKKAWDGLCNAVKGTAKFMLDNIGAILLLSGVIYVGYKLKDFAQNLDDESLRRIEDILKQNVDTSALAMAALVKADKLPADLRKRIYKIRKALPLDKSVADNLGWTDKSTGDHVRAILQTSVDTLCGRDPTASAARASALERTRRENNENCSQFTFLALIDRILGGTGEIGDGDNADEKYIKDAAKFNPTAEDCLKVEQFLDRISLKYKIKDA